MNKKTALITGASGGIGYELARLFAQDGYNLVLVARSEEKLKKITAELEDKYRIYVRNIIKDLTCPGAADEIFSITESEQLKINVLVNNAGYGAYGEFIHNELTNQLDMIQLNITALTHLSWLYGNEMSKTGSGKILNIASMAAFQAGPLMAVYYATKAFVLSLSEALNNELITHKVVVSCFCPGPVETDFQQRASLHKSKLFDNQKIMDAESAAKAAYIGLKENKAVVIPGIINKILQFSTRLAPRKLVTQVARLVQERKTADY